MWSNPRVMVRFATPGALIAAALWSALLFALLAPVSFASDDYAHLQMVAQFGGVADALDPGLVPLRPLQHAYFYAFGGSEVVARLPIFAAFAGALGLVWMVCRLLGGSYSAAAIAVLLFSVFPHVTNLGWVATVGWSGRQIALLGGLAAYVLYDRHRDRRAGMAVIGALLMGLGFHQSSVLLVPWCVLWSWTRHGWGRLAPCWRDPVLWTMVLVVVPYAVYLFWFRPQRVHGSVESAAVLSSFSRASICLLPIDLREPVLEGLRAGGAGRLLAAAMVLAVAGLFGRALLVSPISRFIALCILGDLALSALTTPFAQRYAYSAAALCACGLGLWTDGTARRSLRYAVIGVLVIALGSDSLRLVRHYRQLDQVIPHIREVAARRAADLGPGQRLVFVDVPGAFGPDGAVPLFRWGMPQALERWGIRGDFLWWSTAEESVDDVADARRVTPADVEAATSNPRVVLLRFDRQHLRFSGESREGDGR